MKFARETAVYLACYLASGLVCAGYAAAWHDFIAAYHLSMDHHGSRPQGCR